MGTLRRRLREAGEWPRGVAAIKGCRTPAAGCSLVQDVLETRSSTQVRTIEAFGEEHHR